MRETCVKRVYTARSEEQFTQLCDERWESLTQCPIKNTGRYQGRSEEGGGGNCIVTLGLRIELSYHGSKIVLRIIQKTYVYGDY